MASGQESTQRHLQPKSLGGELPITRRCWSNQHKNCTGSWTAYPDESGSCECECHAK